MADDKLRMPMGSAGITSFYDDYRSKIEFTPAHVIVFAVVVILIVVVLHIWVSGLLGLA